MTEPTPIRRHRRYTRRRKAEAVMAAAATSVLAAAETTGIPRSTLRYWLEDPEYAELRQKTQAEASQGWQVIQHLALARLRQLIPDMEARDLIVLAGVSVDKSQLLSGGATERLEHRELMESFNDHEVDAIEQWLLEEARKRMAADA